MIVFAVAQGVAWLYVARIMQGLAPVIHEGGLVGVGMV
jgi:hypothetical protein